MKKYLNLLLKTLGLVVVTFIIPSQIYAVNEQGTLVLPNGDFSDNDAHWTNSGFSFKNGEYAYLNVNSTEILTMSNQIHCVNPEIKTFSFDYGWNNGTSGGNGTHNTIAALDVHIDGVRYLYISTPRDGGANIDNATDQGGDALVTAYNGATFTISNPSSQGSQYIDHSSHLNWTFTTITIQLPENAVTKGKIKFYGRANADDFAIDNVRFDLPGNTCIVDAPKPNYAVALDINKTTFDKPSNFFVKIRVTELDGGINSGDIVYSINKNEIMSLSYDKTLTLDSDGGILNNKDWEWIDAGTTYRLKYIGTSKKYPKNSRAYIGINGVFTPQVGSRGQFVFKVKLRPGSGDTFVANNEDSDTLSYSN